MNTEENAPLCGLISVAIMTPISILLLPITLPIMLPYWTGAIVSGVVYSTFEPKQPVNGALFVSLLWPILFPVWLSGSLKRA